MVSRIIKQIVAVLIALAFVASLFFFIPKQSNPNYVSELILVPSNLIVSSANSTKFTQYNANLSVIAGTSAIQIGSLSKNVSSLLNLTKVLLESQNITFSLSGGNLCIDDKSLFKQNLCNNQNYTWILFVSYNGQTPSQLNEPLSSIDLNSLYNSQNEFILLYQYINNTQQKLPSL